MQLAKTLNQKKLLGVLAGLILLVATILRFSGLATLPPSLYWEEAALGYDAYSILQTGRDHHGNWLPLVAFESFGDWKPSLYFYAVLPFIQLFGLSSLAVRLPAALSGLAIVIGTGVLAGQLTTAFWDKKLAKRYVRTLSLLVMALTAISPWAIVFSRAGWEVNLATALVTWAVVCFLDQKRLLAVILLVLSMYAYHAARIVAPLMGVGLMIVWWWQARVSVATFIKRNFSQILLLVFTALILLLPIILSLGSQTTNQRFAETSIFSDLAVIEQSNQLKDLADNVWWSKIIYHRYLLFGREVMVNFLSHFRADFLFISGDANPRHSIQYLGQLYYLDALFLLIGVYGLIKRRSVAGMLLLFWLVIGIFPASITKASPHALRILPTLPVFMILVGAGILSFWDWLKRQQLSQTWPSLPTLVASLILLAYLSQLAMFWRFYSKIYPVEYSQEWQYGYQQMVASLQAVQETNPQLPVFVSRELGRPAMYYWFYSQTDPAVVQAESQTATKDQSEFLTFANLTFFTKTDQVMAPAIVASTDQTFQQLSTTYQVTQLETVTDLQQRRVWIIYLVE